MLYELPEHQNIKLYIEDKVIMFDHLDGFYSYCWLEEDKSKIVHIKATTKFKRYKDGYKIVERDEWGNYYLSGYNLQMLRLLENKFDMSAYLNKILEQYKKDIDYK